jgi:GTP-binding protein HflX
VVLTPEVALTLTTLTRDMNRVVGLLVDRRGQIEHVILGDARRLYLPDVGRLRAGTARFRGLRLLRTHLAGDPLSQDDLTDLSRLQLDVVASVQTLPDGRPGRCGWAHLVPVNPQGDLWSTHQVRHVAELDWSFSAFIRDLEGEFEEKADRSIAVRREGAMLVYVRTRDDWQHEARLAELHELCRTAGVPVLDTYVQSRARMDPKYGVGQGALEDIEQRCLQLGADTLIFGQDLEPAQHRSINARTDLKVVDRTQLILDIFAQRAQSKVGKLQVELAQLRYRLPRLSHAGTGMSRLAGGVGGRGPGEMKLEIDRRRARDRIRALEGEVKRIAQGRALRRQARQQKELPVVSIVGYTNAGKSTLLNTLTQSSVLSEDKLFATLDPTSRRLRFPQDRAIILTDTVGFIRDLPKDLREAFGATLEELQEADLLLHVVDASDPDHEAHIESTLRILKDLDIEETPRLLVWNKCDRVPDEDRNALAVLHGGLFVSALQRESSRALIDAIDAWLIRHGRADQAGPPAWARPWEGDDETADGEDDAWDDESDTSAPTAPGEKGEDDDDGDDPG